MDQWRRAEVSGPLHPYVEGFTASLVAQGYRSGRNLVDLMAAVSRWLTAEGLGTADLTGEQATRFVESMRADAHSSLSMRGVRPLLDYLRSIDVIPAARAGAALTPLDALIERYRSYLATERGFATDSIRVYIDVARSFLVHVMATDGEIELATLSTAMISNFVLAECQRGQVGSAKSMTTRLRSFLRFLHVEGITPNGLAGAVPSVAHWRLASLPMAIPAPDIELMLQGCDRSQVVGRRDFAIITLLARFGLRAGEVTRLSLDDIDWRKGELVVSGKGNRTDRLPLPVDVGEAIVGWLQLGRPQCASTLVFLRLRAPLTGLSSGAVSAIVARACDRAGVAPSGAHRLRHSAATQMLRARSSLAEVGQVLRHRSAEVTSTYAKLDETSLAAVVQPWPGGAA